MTQEAAGTFFMCYRHARARCLHTWTRVMIRKTCLFFSRAVFQCFNSMNAQVTGYPVVTLWLSVTDDLPNLDVFAYLQAVRPR